MTASTPADPSTIGPSPVPPDHLRAHVTGHDGDRITYAVRSRTRPWSWVVTLDVARHWSRCDCEAGRAGRAFCAHARAAVIDHYAARARAIVAREPDDALDQRARACATLLLACADDIARARRNRQPRLRRDAEEVALRCKIMIDACGDQIAARSAAASAA
jgi:hypothetical protein